MNDMATSMLLRAGSAVEVFIKHSSCNRFWVARIVATQPHGFWFVFEDDVLDAEFMWYKDFSSLWRFRTHENTDLTLRHQQRYKTACAR